MQATRRRSAGAGRSSPRPAAWHLWNMCLGLFGVQIVWGLQNVNTSRIFQTLGADVDELALLWIAAPITGLLVQPVVGHLSDRTWGRLGRRRPYILAGGLLTALALLAMPSVTTLWSACVMLWVLTASINIAMEPFRALVADTLPEPQRTSAFALQVFFIGAGAVFASALPWMLTNWFGVGGGAETVSAAYAVGALVLVVTVGWSVATTLERPPGKLAAGSADIAHPEVPSARGAVALARSGVGWAIGGGLLAGLTGWVGAPRELYLAAGISAVFGLLQLAAVLLRRRGRTSIGMVVIVEDILHMPPVLKRLALVQFFTWFGMFALWVYAIPAVAALDPAARDPGSAAYGRSADWVGMLFAEYNAVAALIALALPAVALRVGRRACHALCLGCGALGLLGFATFARADDLWLPAIGIGVAWAATLSLPYAMLSDGVPARKMGVYMGIHNIFIVLPQLVAAATLGVLVRVPFGGAPGGALMVAAVALAAGAGLALTIPKAPDA
ncbi:MFS transporter [Sphingomonas sp. HF-S4]|uniref:MFS transporter n=1 Tax=Sphingomonas agrestis TaxID=3080540 RepID=A0ABU3Y663_9SPHN|nr:MFS transporter [Sphingomonas sp. HF-S4]MDV3456883.1 MFS transporter [Sphingomonas sp. HF-S4]